MYRIVNMSGKNYALEVALTEQKIENIEQFLSEGMPVILVADVEDFDEEVEIVEAD